MKRKPRRKLVSFMGVDKYGRRKRVKFLASTSKKRKRRGLRELALVAGEHEGSARLSSLRSQNLGQEAVMYARAGKCDRAINRLARAAFAEGEAYAHSSASGNVNLENELLSQNRLANSNAEREITELSNCLRRPVMSRIDLPEASGVDCFDDEDL